MMHKTIAVLLLSTAAMGSGCSKSAQSHFDRGSKYSDAKRYKEAVVEFRTAVAKDSHFVGARTRLADTYLTLGDVPNALREYSRAADLAPFDTTLQLKAGELLLYTGQFDDAKSRAEKALIHAPKNVEAQILLGNALAGLRDLGAAIKEVQTAISTEPERSVSYASLGLLQQANGQPAEAEATFLKAISIDAKSVPARLALANLYWRTGRTVQSEELLKSAIRLEPHHALANRALAMLYVNTKRVAEAEAPLREIVATSGDPTARLALADYYVAAGRGSDAVAVLSGITNADAIYSAAQLRLARIAIADNRREDANRFVRTVRIREPKNLPAMILEGEILLADGQLPRALAIATTAVATEPGVADSYFLLGRVQHRLGHLKEATGAFNEVLKIAPGASAAKVELAKVALQTGDVAGAVQLADQAAREWPTKERRLLFLTALIADGKLARAEADLAVLQREYPKSSSVQVSAGDLAVAKGDTVAAQKAFNSALDADPGNRAALVGLTKIDLAAGRAMSARGRLETRLSQEPDNPLALMLLARTALVQSDLAKSEQVLKHVISVAPSTFEAYDLLARIYIQQHRLPEALAEFDRMATDASSAVAGHTAAAIVLQMQKKIGDAKSRYQRALAIDPRAAVAANNLAWLYAEGSDNLDIALQLAQTAKSQMPDNPDVNDTLGWVYYRKGMASLAVAPLEQSVRTNGANALYRFHLGLAYLAAGDKKRARTALERALTLEPDFEGASEARKTLASL